MMKYMLREITSYDQITVDYQSCKRHRHDQRRSGTIGDVLKAGDKVTIAGFGRFEMRERQTKNFTNPKTKVTSQLEPTAIPGFKASGRLKEKVGK